VLWPEYFTVCVLHSDVIKPSKFRVKGDCMKKSVNHILPYSLFTKLCVKLVFTCLPLTVHITKVLTTF